MTETTTVVWTREEEKAVLYTRHLNDDYERILSFYHSIGSPIDGAHPGPKTDRDNLGRYCP